jgi:hypothetical protein
MLKKTDRLLYLLKKPPFPGERFNHPELPGLYAGVPDKGYKGHPFKIQYIYPTVKPDGSTGYSMVEVQVPDWNKAVAFRKMPDQFGTGFFTLGYFKVAESL